MYELNQKTRKIRTSLIRKFGEKLVKVFFGGVILKDDLTFLVDDCNVRNTSETPVLEVIFVFPVHLGLVPSLLCDTFVDCCGVLV